MSPDSHPFYCYVCFGFEAVPQRVTQADPKLYASASCHPSANKPTFKHGFVETKSLKSSTFKMVQEISHLNHACVHLFSANCDLGKFLNFSVPQDKVGSSSTETFLLLDPSLVVHKTILTF